MMGLAPADLAGVFDDLEVPPVAIGANCGVGAADLLVAVQQIARPGTVVIAKSNCGIPQFHGSEIVYSGDPSLMGRYAAHGGRFRRADHRRLLRHVARTPGRDAALARASRTGSAPSIDDIVATVGPLTNSVATDAPVRERRGRRGR